MQFLSIEKYIEKVYLIAFKKFESCDFHRQLKIENKLIFLQMIKYDQIIQL